MKIISDKKIINIITITITIEFYLKILLLLLYFLLIIISLCECMKILLNINDTKINNYYINKILWIILSIPLIYDINILNILD